MITNMEERACLLAEYIIENRATCRAAAKKFGISKSTVHKDISDRLRAHHPALYRQAQEVLQENKAQRHLRGGEATKRKWKRRKQLDAPPACDYNKAVPADSSKPSCR